MVGARAIAGVGRPSLVAPVGGANGCRGWRQVGVREWCCDGREE